MTDDEMREHERNNILAALKASGGKANPAAVNEILTKKLGL